MRDIPTSKQLLLIWRLEKRLGLESRQPNTIREASHYIFTLKSLVAKAKKEAMEADQAAILDEIKHHLE